MTRLFVHVEGETEETFVNELLRPHLNGLGYNSVSAKLLGNARARSKRGGIKNWTATKGDILRHLRGDQAIIATVMVDYYALPANGNNAWPGRQVAPNISASEKGKLVEAAILSDIAQEMGVSEDMCRFVPYVMMYEFEALLFSDCTAFANGIGMPQLEVQLRAIRDSFDSPEEINDSPITAPSKRVGALIPGYEKPLYGNIAASAVGFDQIRSECTNFSDWLDRLEKKL